jgi:integrase/recombinase XerD
MNTKEIGQGIILNTLLDDYLTVWVNSWFIDCKIRGLSINTLTFYQKKIAHFLKFCDSQAIIRISQITPQTLREYLIYAENTGHNRGGQHGFYRTIKAFLRWFDVEAEPENWTNPIKKVKAPKVNIDPLDPIDLQDLKLILDTCNSKKLSDLRDKAILLCLLDTGARAEELLNMDLSDIELITGSMTIKHGKGGKGREVYIGSKARKVLRTYIKARNDDIPYLWIKLDATGRLDYYGLRAILNRRCDKAGVRKWMPHSFRRAFALNMLRAGCDVYSLQKLMGHADLQILLRYLAITREDTRAAHQRSSPVDFALK